VAAALRDGTIRWAPGLRLGSAACGGPRGLQCTAAFHALRGHILPLEAPACRAAPTFRFVELFAGIGGFRLGLEALVSSPAQPPATDHSRDSQNLHNTCFREGAASSARSAIPWPAQHTSLTTAKFLTVTSLRWVPILGPI
jgi:hypothetical protein